MVRPLRSPLPRIHVSQALSLIPESHWQRPAFLPVSKGKSGPERSHGWVKPHSWLCSPGQPPRPEVLTPGGARGLSGRKGQVSPDQGPRCSPHKPLLPGPPPPGCWWLSSGQQRGSPDQSGVSPPVRSRERVMTPSCSGTFSPPRGAARESGCCARQSENHWPAAGLGPRDHQQPQPQAAGRWRQGRGSFSFLLGTPETAQRACELEKGPAGQRPEPAQPGLRLGTLPHFLPAAAKPCARGQTPTLPQMCLSRHFRQVP